MRVRVAVAPASGAGQNSNPPEVLEIQCGTGQQILRWLGYAACTRLAHKRGEVMGCYVPQAVVKDSTVLDVDLVLSEVVEDGELLLVEYNCGPEAYTTRWEQRAKSPVLSWDDTDALDAAAPSPTAWLQEWDLHAEGLAALILAAAPGQQQHQPQQAVHSPHAEQQKAQGQQQAEQHAPAPGTAEVPKQEATQQEGQQGQLEQQKAAAAQAHQQHQPVLDSAAAVAADQERLRGVMLQHAGALQMLFLLCASETASPMDTTTRMGLQQFKTMLQTAKVTSSSVPAERVDELYAALQASPGAAARKGRSQFSTTSGMDFADFLLLLVHVSYHRFAGESFLTGASSTQLSTKLLSLLQDCICTHLFPELQRRLDKLKGAVTPASKMLLKKGRRLTEQVLERCQIRRVRSHGALSVPYTYVLKHLERWGLLGKEFTLQELAPVVIFAKQETTDPYRFVLHSQPLALGYDEFEKLLLGIATLQARLRKRSDVDEQLGELLDLVYRKSGVLVSLTTS